MKATTASPPVAPSAGRFCVTRVSHRALGPQVHLEIEPGLSLRLMPAEAKSLALALSAVAQGRSPEREIFMSPLGSDGYFTGKVETQGLRVDAVEPTILLSWPQVLQLANELQELAAEHLISPS